MQRLSEFVDRRADGGRPNQMVGIHARGVAGKNGVVYTLAMTNTTETTSTERATSVLRRRILRGELPPGARLQQVEIAQQLGVSRIPVRDAFQALAAEGLIALSRSGAMVTQMTIEDLQELYELRGAVEPLASRLGSPNISRADLLRMNEQFDRMERTQDDLDWLTANTAFHAVLYERSNRPRMVELIEQLRKQTQRYLHLHLAVIGNTEHLQEEHKLILQAAERGDAAAVESLTGAHLASSHDFILRYLLESGLVEESGAVPPAQVLAAAERLEARDDKQQA